MTDSMVIEARDLAIGYAGRTVGHGLSLSVSAHEVLCLLGPNGSGKSTLFWTLLGLLPPLAGTVRVQGKPLSSWSRDALARQVAYVPQAQADMFPFTVHEIVLMGRTARVGRFSGPSRCDQKIASQCLERMGIASLSQRPYTDISGGERQLALIARALAQEPAVMVMDEPTASLDFGNQLRVLEYIKELSDKGMGVLFCTHQPDHALRVADRVVLLKGGRLQPLASTAGDDVIAGLAWLYDLDKAVVAGSLPSFFHSTQCMDSKDDKGY